MPSIPRQHGPTVIRTGHMLEHDRNTIPYAPRDEGFLTDRQFVESFDHSFARPRMSIVRFAYSSGALTDGEYGWKAKLQELSEDNSRLGKAVEYGEVVLTLLTDADVERMIRKKEPNLYVDGTDRDITMYLRKLGSSFADFAHSRADAVNDRINRLIEERAAYAITSQNVLDEAPYHGRELQKRFKAPQNPDELVGLWGYLTLRVMPDLEAIGKSTLALSTVMHPHLAIEDEQIDDWLLSQRLDPNLRTERLGEVPMLPIFHYKPGRYNEAIEIGGDLPQVISLTPPHVNYN